MTDRPTEDAIRLLVDRFYARVRADPLIGPIFLRSVGEYPGDWDEHLQTLYDFWSSILLGSGRYKGNPMLVHRRLPELGPELFDRWIALFDATAAELFPPDLAETVQAAAHRIRRRAEVNWVAPR